MAIGSRSVDRTRRTLAAAGLVLVFVSTARGADHGDMPILATMGRSDAMITDLHVFRREDKLVLSLCTNPNVPPSLVDYKFASDLVIRFSIDNRSAVSFDDPLADIEYGGTVVDPVAITERIALEVTFDKKGRPRLKTWGIHGRYKHQIALFAGLRDDPFIRRPREGRNVAAVVIELPMEAVDDDDDECPLLVWATTKVPELNGPMSEFAGRALRSMFFPEMNAMTPSEQALLLGHAPDVVIYQAEKPARFPNGRDLTDDVVDMVIDIPGGSLPGEGPTFPTMNDVPFLDEFPYLAPPHPPLP